jgi:phosphoribosyl 1,2-cyclic phosphodiesterase
MPIPGPTTVRVGGNTSCVDVLTTDQQVIILDAGTGIRRLGQKLKEEHPNRLVGTMLISHTHWDHIQGFPFFVPAFVRNNRFIIIGQKRIGQHLENVLRGQVVEPYLPFEFNEFKADIVVKEIGDGESMIVGDDSVVEARSLSHPGGSLGFRIENKGVVLAYCTDTNHPEGGFTDNVLRLGQNADLLIHDSQFSLEQRERFPEWGHSSWLEAAQAASEANAKYLAMFHHDPDSTDQHLKSLLSRARQIFPNTLLAYEGLELDLPLASLPEPNF